ncbi:MAG: MoxR family ATPase [Candidatus Melainabacteria bacterium]|nr:MoxR family ATPase [Candidatus Melainabacteria bacterium]
MINQNVSDVFSRLIGEMNKVVIGYADIKRLSIAALLADQHVLLEGLPGTAKSLFVEVFQRAVSDSQAVRIQMTADVKPMDLVGVKVYNPSTGRFDFEEGPMIGKNFVLVDKINRAPGKTLSAVLSGMQERRIYISGREFALPDPYFVMATQNPIEQEGVYPLPEAAVDRFGGKLIVPYATAEEEEAILSNEALDERDPQNVVQPVVSVKQIVELRQAIKKGVFVSPAAKQYIVALVRATRPDLAEHADVAKQDGGFKDMIEVGSSVRGQLALRGFARVLAAVKGRAYVLPEDVQEVALPVLRHRVALKFEAAADGKTSDQAVASIVKHVKFSKADDQYVPVAA